MEYAADDRPHAPVTSIVGRLADGTAARVRFERERIAAVEPLGSGETDDVDDVPWILPGMVDLQVNGYGGIDVNADDLTAEDIHRLVREQWRRGVTTFLPTVVTAPREKIVNALRVIASARAEDPLTAHTVAGVHVEGPYLSPEDGPRGAHDATQVRAPDLDEFTEWREASGDAVRLVTLAPETPGAMSYIQAVTRQGTVASIGHAAATAEQVHAAAAAGARMSTHLGNGCHPTLPRHPNHIWAQLADTRLAASFVADGHHLPADTFIAMVRATGGSRAILVSDSVALAGCAPGEYDAPVGGRVTLHPGGRLTLAGSELLAGSAASQFDCLSWALAAGGLDLVTASSMASSNPARLLALRNRGRVEAGSVADLAILSPDRTTVRSTVVRGRQVHRG